MADNRIPEEFEGLNGTMIGPGGVETQIGEAPAEEPETPSEEPEEPEAPAASEEPEKPEEPETPSEEPEAPAAEKKEIDYSQFGEDVKDIEGVRTAMSQKDQKIQELKEQLENQQNSPSVKAAAEYGAFINKAGFEDPVVYNQVKNLNLDSTEVDPIDLLVLARKIDKKGNMDAAQEQAYRKGLISKYRQDSEQFDEDEVAVGSMDLEDATESARAKIKELQESYKSVQPEDTQAKIDHLKSEWNPKLTEMLADENAGKLNFKLERGIKLGDEESDIEFSYDVPKEVVEKAYAEAMGLAIKNGAQPTPEMQKNLKLYVTQGLQNRFQQEITQKAVTVASEKMHEYYAKLIDNPSPLKKGGDQKEQTGNEEKSASDVVFEAEMGR